MKKVLRLAALGVALVSAPGASAAYDDSTCRATVVSWTNDPCAGRQWGHANVRAPQAWATSRGTGVTVAVVDTGADFNHPDLAANLVSVAGSNLVANQSYRCPGQGSRVNKTSSAVAQDDQGHGTHVAGTIAAVTGNGVGVAGVAPGAKVLPVKVLNAQGSGSDADVAAGICFAVDKGAKVINLSLGGLPGIGTTPQFNAEIAKAAAYAYSKGALVVAASGNESMPLCSYPAAASKAVCVGAVDRRGFPAAYSNFPQSMEDAVGVRAPGGMGDQLSCESPEDIWSTVWPEGDVCRDTNRPQYPDLSGYETFAGTSMAAPFVSGVAAVLSARGLSNGQILQCLKTTSSKNGAYDPVMGYGIVNLDAATRRCSASRTPSFGGRSGGTARKPLRLRVSHKRIGARRFARKRKLRVTVRSNRRVTVRLRAFARRKGKKPRRLGTKRIHLKKAGKRVATIRIKRRTARWLRKHRKAKVRVRYRGGGRKGWARVRR